MFIFLFVFQSYSASVSKGTNPTYKWIVDDKPYFTYYNTVLNVIYQHAAVYKLTVSVSDFVITLPGSCPLNHYDDNYKILHRLKS